MTQIAPRPGIMEIALYQSGQSGLPGVDHPLKLSSNENPFGPSPAAIRAVAEAAARMHLYPPTDHAGLRATLGEIHGLDPDRIICGVGSDEIFSFLCNAYAGPGDEVLYTEHGFSMYRICALAAGATPVIAPETERRVDVDAVLAAVTDRTRLVFIANPGNPTGTMLAAPELERLADGIPGSCLLILDGAYAEFAQGYDGGAALAEGRANVVMTRTLSKAYGLGGLRVGWAYGPRAVIEVLDRIRQPFNLSVPALAGAEAALRDRAFLDRCLAVNAAERLRLTEGLRRAGAEVDESCANFVLARLGSEAAAEAADRHFKAAGIILRRVAGYGFPDGLRITVGRPPDVTRVLDTMAAFEVPA